MSKKSRMMTIAVVAVALAAAGARAAFAPDKYSVKVPGGLAFSEFKGYENWSLIAISQNGPAIAAILGNPVIIEAYRAGVPANGKPFPDGAKMVKVHWTPTKKEAYPGQPTVPGVQRNADFMEKDSKRFADSGGWGWAAFEFDDASQTFRPGTQADKPPQANDAKCGLACHTKVETRDYVFTEYARR